MDDNLKSALICRVCMKTDGLLLSMFDGDISYKQLANKLAIIASIEVEESDGLPNVLCTKCAYRTDAFYNFRCQVQKSEQQLRKMMTMQKTLSPTISDNEIVQTKDLKAQYYDYDEVESEINDILPSVLINTNDLSQIDVSLSSVKINNDVIKDINTSLINRNNDEFLFFNHKPGENIDLIGDSAGDCMLFSIPSKRNKDSDSKYESMESEIDLENSETNEIKADELFNHEMDERNDEDSAEDYDTDDYIDTSDNLLGSLNDTIVRIKEIKLADGKLKYQCTLCMHDYNELPEILIHTVDNHIPNSGPFYCVVCEKDCENQRELRSHVKSHTGMNPYTCFICNKAYSMKRYLKRHMTCHTDFARYRCSKCGQRFKIKAELENHSKIHFDGTSAAFTCNQCNKVFNYKSTYKRHLIMHLDPGGVSLPKYPCCVCGKRFVNNRTLKIHMRVHTGEKPFLCQICNRAFSQQGNLLNHIKIHSDPRRYTCDVCGKRFNQRATLRDHTLLHTGEKPYVCSVCGLAFTFGAALRRHLWTHADDKPLGCEICNARFVGKYDLNRHMKIHWDKSKTKRKKNKTQRNNDCDIVLMDDCRVEDDIILTQVAESVPETIFIEHVLIDQSPKDQIVISREDSEKENVDALFHLIEYTY